MNCVIFNDMTFEFFKRCKIVLFNSLFMNNTVINHYGVFTLMSSHAEMTSFSMLVIQNIRIRFLPVNDIGENNIRAPFLIPKLKSI